MEKQMEDLQQKLKEQEKLASLGLLSAGIAHEIQNPLNFVINFSKMSDKLLGDLTDIVEDNEDKLSDDDREEVEDIVADLKENMAKIVEHGERAISIIRGILLMSRGKDNEYLPTDVCRLVKEYVWRAYHEHQHQGELSGGHPPDDGHSPGPESCCSQHHEQCLLCRPSAQSAGVRLSAHDRS